MKRRRQLKCPRKEEIELRNRFSLRGSQALLLFAASAPQLSGLMALNLQYKTEALAGSWVSSEQVRAAIPVPPPGSLAWSHSPSPRTLCSSPCSGFSIDPSNWDMEVPRSSLAFLPLTVPPFCRANLQVPSLPLITRPTRCFKACLWPQPSPKTLILFCYQIPCWCTALTNGFFGDLPFQNW